MNFQHIQSAHAYTQLIQQQQDYLESHRNISISNLTIDDLNTQIDFNNNKTSMLTAINQTNTISWISPDNSSSSNQKINFSTTVTNYPTAFSFLKGTIQENIPQSIMNSNFRENNPVLTPQLSPTMRNYLTALTLNIPKSKSPNVSTPSKHSHKHSNEKTSTASPASPSTQSNVGHPIASPQPKDT